MGNTPIVAVAVCIAFAADACQQIFGWPGWLAFVVAATAMFTAGMLVHSRRKGRSWRR